MLYKYLDPVEYTSDSLQTSSGEVPSKFCARSLRREIGNRNTIFLFKKLLYFWGTCNTRGWVVARSGFYGNALE